MAIQKSFVGILRPAELIKKEITKPIMDQAVAIKFNQMRLMCLAAAHNGCACVCYAMEISNHLLCWIPAIDLLVLERKDHLVTLIFQSVNLLDNLIHVAMQRPGVGFTGSSISWSLGVTA